MTPAQRPIGVFDSGIGGLTIVEAIKKRLPQEAIIYYGDTAHLPYGDKSPDVLRGYIARITRFLISQQVKAIVIACNTASSVAYQDVAQIAHPLPVFEVISPAVREAVALSPAHRIGVIGTHTTIMSHTYLVRILELAPKAFVVEKATPLLVPLIEDGWLNHDLTPRVIEAYMSDTGFRHIDTLILGCTHYPLLQPHIQAYFDQSQQVRVINSSDATAHTLAAYLEKHHLLATAPSELPDRYYVSDVTPQFLEQSRKFFSQEISLTKLPLHDLYAD